MVDAREQTATHMEWRAWHRIALALDELSIDMNAQACKPLVEAIKDWGEWRTQQHLTQNFEYHHPPAFDPDEVGAAMARRTIRANPSAEAIRETT